MDSVEITIRAIDQASRVLERINTLLSKMIGAVTRLNRAFASMQAPAFSNMFNSKTYNKNIAGMNAEQLALQRQHQMRLATMRTEAQQNMQRQRLHAQQSARNAQVVRDAQKRVAAEEAANQRATANARRHWTAQQFFAGFSSAGGHARAISGAFGAGWTGLGGIGRALGTVGNQVLSLAGQINTQLWGAITRVFSLGIQLATQLAQRMMMVGAAIAGIVVGGMTLLGKKSLDVASQVQQVQISLKSMIGDTGTANSFLSEMMDFARRTPFNFFEGMIDHIRRLIGVGFGLREVTSLMQDMGDAAAALGVGEPGLVGMVKAFSDIRAKGYVQAQEITRQFAEWGVPALRYIAQAYGVSSGAAMKMIEKRQITGDQGISAIQAGMRRDFGGSMGLQFNTFQGRLNTLKETIQYALAGIGDKAKNAFTGIFAGLSETIWKLVQNGTMSRVGEWFASLFTPERVMRFVDVLAKGLAVAAHYASIIYKAIASFVEQLASGNIWRNIGNSLGMVGDYIVNMFDWALSKLPGLAKIYIGAVFSIIPFVVKAAIYALIPVFVEVVAQLKPLLIGIGGLMVALGNPLQKAAGALMVGIGLGAKPMSEEMKAWYAEKAASQLSGIPSIIGNAGQQAFNYATAGNMPQFGATALPNTALGQWIARQGYGAARNPNLGAVELPPWYAEMRNTFGTEFANGVVGAVRAAAMNQDRAASAQLAATQEGNQTLKDMLNGEVFGGGDRLRRLSARFNMYRPGEMVAVGGGANININLSGGNADDRQSVTEAMRQLARTLAPGSTVSINGRRGK